MVEAQFRVLLFYKYQEVSDVKKLVTEQEKLCKSLKLGTLGGSADAVDKYIRICNNIWDDIDWKMSQARIEDCFGELLIKETASIVGHNPELKYSVQKTGIHLDPKDFHENLKDPRALIIDVRNDYEYSIGRFDNAVNPNTRSFTQFSTWLDTSANNGLFNNRSKIMMYCTGGIRCEKASIELKAKLDVDVPVFQLKGGIHRYLEAFQDKPEQSKFRGKNFVFDKRNSQEGFGTVGKCLSCATDFDEIKQDRRCHKCRALILICDRCHESLNGKYWCNSHGYLNIQTYLEHPDKISSLHKRLGNIEERLNSEEYQGRRKRAKRLALRKQKTELQNLLAAAQTHKDS